MSQPWSDNVEFDKEYAVTPVFAFVKRFFLRMHLGTPMTIANYGYDDSTRCDCGNEDSPMGRHHRQANRASSYYSCPAYCDCDKTAQTTCHYHRFPDKQERLKKYLAGETIDA